MAADDNVLLLTMHHIVSDGWSMGMLHPRAERAVRRLPRRRARSAPAAAGAVRGLRGVAAAVAGGPVLEAQAEYWTGRWPARPCCWSCPPTTRAPRSRTLTGASLEVELDEALAAALRGCRSGTAPRCS